MRNLLPLSLLLLAACGGSDPKTSTSEGYAALGKGDAKAALVKFDAALSALQPTDKDYYYAALGRCQALAKTDPAEAKRSFLELAQKLGKETVRENDYSIVCAALVQSNAAVEAVEVMHEGMKTFDKSEKMQQILDAVKTAAAHASTPEALQKLASLGYT